jgi:hypothetical protein
MDIDNKLNISKSLTIFITSMVLFGGILIFPKTKFNFIAYTKYDISLILFYLLITFVLAYAVINYVTSQYSFIELTEKNKLQIIDGNVANVNSISWMFSILLPIIFGVSLFYYIHNNEYKFFSNEYKSGVIISLAIIWILIIISYQVQSNISVTKKQENPE